MIYSSWLSSLKFLQINEFVWSPGLGDLRSLPTLYEDWVNKKRSNDSVSPDRDEDNRVSSVPDADGGENPAHGTDGLESSVQSVIWSFLWRVVDESGNSGNWEGMFEKFKLENDLRNTPPYSDQLNQITNNVRSEFPQLWQLRKRDPSLSPEDLKVYCVPLCWSSKKRVDFLSDLSDELSSRADELKTLMLELERTWQLHFGEKRNDKIDDELLSGDELKKLMLELERTWQLHFGVKQNDQIDDELLSRVDELKKLMLELQRMWQLHFGEKRNDKIDELLSRADELKELRLELERTWQLHFGEKWNDKIDEEWIKKFGEKDWRPHFGEKWINKIDEKWIEKNGKKWIDKIDKKWIEKNGKERIKSTNRQYMPSKSNQSLCRGLLRLMRNRRHHPDEFMKSNELLNVRSFYNYFDKRFPNLLMLSYGAAYWLCRKEPWFKDYLPSETI